MLVGHLMAVVIVGVVMFFVQLHAATADWWPKGVPTQVQYAGRDISCSADGHAGVGQDAPRGLIARGHTIGGGTICSPPGDGLPFGIAVADGSIVRSCSLSGGP